MISLIVIALVMLGLAVKDRYFNGIHNIGTSYPLILSLMLLVLALLSMVAQTAIQAAWLILGVHLMIALFITVIAAVRVKNESLPIGNQSAIYIILGFYVIGNEPSKMLKNRLQITLSHCQNSIDYTIIVSGGQGPNEQYPEGQVMAQYLISQGLPSEKIMIEDQSHSTSQNLLYSYKIIQERRLKGQVVIVSDYFHLYRAHKIWQEITQKPCCLLGCVTDWTSWQTYWVREWFAILRYWLMKK